MALQSQMLRGSSNIRSSSATRARNRGQRKTLGVVVLVLVIGGAFVYLVRGRDGGSGVLGPQAAKAEPSTPALPAADKVIVPPLKDPIATVPAPKPEPMVLQMGSKPRPGSQPAPSTALPTLSSATRPSVAIRQPAPADTAERSLAAITAPPAATPPSAVREQPPAAPAAPASVAPQPSTASNSDTAGLPGELAAVQTLAERAIAERRLVDARTQLNKILVDPRVGEKDREGLRRWIAELNKDLVFSANAFPGDPLAETYTVQKGDSLGKICRKLNTVTEPGMLQRVNGVAPTALRAGQPLKIVRGPFHAVVSKSAFRMDIFAGPPPAAGSIGTSGLGGSAEPGWVYIRSFNVGLGKDGGTPLGPFRVKENSKLIDPPWVNPHTGEKFAAKDPKNPIGLRWIGLQGLDESTKAFTSYGIHATIAPESIGKEMSMGCVRMMEEDVDVVYDMLMPTVSVVKIVP